MIVLSPSAPTTPRRLKKPQRKSWRSLCPLGDFGEDRIIDGPSQRLATMPQHFHQFGFRIELKAEQELHAVAARLNRPYSSVV